jgi:hypothetical protein
VSVTFAPSVAGQANGLLTITDDSGNLGGTQTIALAGTGSAPGTCQDVLTLGYAAGTLNIGFTLETPTPTTWKVWLIAQNTTIPLWSIPIPTVTPAVSVNVPIPGIPAIGNILVVTTLSTGSQMGCWDVKAIDTSE